MADMGTFITNAESRIRDLRASIKRAEEIAADLADQYAQLGGATTSDAWFTANPDAKEYTGAQFSTAMGNLSAFSDLIPTPEDNTFMAVVGYTPRKA